MYVYEQTLRMRLWCALGRRAGRLLVSQGSRTGTRYRSIGARRALRRGRWSRTGLCSRRRTGSQRQQSRENRVHKPISASFMKMASAFRRIILKLPSGIAKPLSRACQLKQNTDSAFCIFTDRASHKTTQKSRHTGFWQGSLRRTRRYRRPVLPWLHVSTWPRRPARRCAGGNVVSQSRRRS